MSDAEEEPIIAGEGEDEDEGGSGEEEEEFYFLHFGRNGHMDKEICEKLDDLEWEDFYEYLPIRHRKMMVKILDNLQKVKGKWQQINMYFDMNGR